jgi:hypothetical protein
VHTYAFLYNDVILQQLLATTHGSLTPFGLASMSARTRARTLSATEAVAWDT